jgi:hypothetical protein
MIWGVFTTQHTKKMSEEWETQEGLLVAPVTKQKQMQNARTFMQQTRKKQTTTIPHTEGWDFICTIPQTNTKDYEIVPINEKIYTEQFILKHIQGDTYQICILENGVLDCHWTLSTDKHKKKFKTIDYTWDNQERGFLSIFKNPYNGSKEAGYGPDYGNYRHIIRTNEWKVKS